MPLFRTTASLTSLALLMLGGCGEKARVLPDDPVEQAASCGVIAAATERAAAGIKGDLPAEAQERIFHYPLLAASATDRFDAKTANAVFQRMPKLFDSVIKGKWQSLRPACATAYPATQVAQPTLPAQPLDSMLQCYMMADFTRKALGGQGPAYAEAALGYGLFTDKLDRTLSPALKRAGVTSAPALQARRDAALAAAAKLGQPSGVIAACQKKYG